MRLFFFSFKLENFLVILLQTGISSSSRVQFSFITRPMLKKQTKKEKRKRKTEETKETIHLSISENQFFFFLEFSCSPCREHKEFG